MDFGRFSILFTTNGDPIILDSCVANEVKHHLWCLAAGYPCTRAGNTMIRLHDYVLARDGIEKEQGMYVDHINMDKLDARRINLHVVTPCENSMNVPMKANNTSGVTGVSRTCNGSYRAYITKDKHRFELGWYRTMDEAVRARKEAEERLGFKTRPTTVKEMCNGG